MTNQEKFQTSEEMEKILQEKFESDMIMDQEESDFLFDALGEIKRSGKEEVEQSEHDALAAKMLLSGKKDAVASGGAPWEGHDATAAFSPITNRGVSKYHNTECSTISPPDTLKKILESVLATESPQIGGYDGGVEIGFDGNWNSVSFNNLTSLLEQKRSDAEGSSLASSEIEVGGMTFRIRASGANAGAYYRYVFEGGGLKFYFHQNVGTGIQPVRLRYGSESLIGRDFYTLHRAVRKWLREIGFKVEQEKLSRVDMQAMIPYSMREFMGLIYGGNAVSKGRKTGTIQKTSRFETYNIGSRDSVQLCIYDKRAELLHMMVADPIKFELMLRHCVDNWFCETELPITRIEFRLARTALKAFGIDSVEDLRNKESGLVDWLTSKWFRLLDKPKKRGHENKQNMHEIWREVRTLFARYFPGPTGNDCEVRWKRRETVSCDCLALRKQAAGCLATALALNFGELDSKEQMAKYLSALLEPMYDNMLEKTNEKVRMMEIVKAVEIEHQKR